MGSSWSVWHPTYERRSNYWRLPDCGRLRNFPWYRIVATRAVGGLENLTALDQLPPADLVAIALPIKTDWRP